jgi:hypothetical protein
MQDDHTLTFPVPPESQGPEPIKKFLADLSSSVASEFQNRFKAPYEVSAADPTNNDGNWEQEVKIRQGVKVGAEVQLKWSRADPAFVTLDVSQNSKLDTYILLGVALPLSVLGAYLAYQDLPPLAFLPGRRLATGLGGVIGLLVGLPVVGVLRSIFGRKQKGENERLIAAVRSTGKDLVGRFAPGGLRKMAG